MNQRDVNLSSVVVDRAQQPHDQFLSLAEATTFGTDGLQYRRLDVRSQLDRFCQPVYFHAIVDGELTGVYVLDKRDLLVDGKAVKAYYRGVLAVDSRFQGMGVGKQLTQAARQWMAAKAVAQPIVSFGCIDKSNRRSLNLLQSSGATVGASLSMYMMYRQWPSVCCELDVLSDDLVSKAGLLADELYAGCLVRDVSVSAIPGWVLQDANGVAISARVSTTSFQITQMGPVAAWSSRLLVKPFAPARKRFDPDCFRYVSFSDVLIRPGCEKLWSRFLSTVLAKYQCHFGAVFVDPHSQLFASLQNAHLLSRRLHSSEGSIRVMWQSFSDANDSKVILPGYTQGVHLWPVDA